MSNILLILFPTQLFEKKYIKKILDYTEDNIQIKNKHIILFEHCYFFTKYPYHKTKLVFHRATMKNYFDLIPSNYSSCYIEHDKITLINKYIQTNSINQIRFFNPIEKELINWIETDRTINLVEKILFPTPYFLNSTKFDTNQQINKSLNVLRHDAFYKFQRIKYNIMVQKDKKSGKYIPEGLTWSFDTANRQKFPNSLQIEPKNLILKSKKRQEYLEEASVYVEKNFSHHYGLINLDQFIYPINQNESIEWLKYFISNKLDNFGKYEDAMSSKIKFGFHSVLSPLTNIGLITPTDIIEHVVLYKNNIASKEGFLRQIIGWREYCYFTYDLYGENLSNTNTSLYKSANKKIPQKVWEQSTQIPLIDNILQNLQSNAYSHHIERLMGIGNFLVLIGCNTKSIKDWFQTMYIDAYDVFMIPNIYGMLSYGKLTNSAHMMTRPYFASSNYLMKMSDYKSNLCVQIKNHKYKWDDIMDALYWSHISKYSYEFKKIYATASGVARWEKFDNNKKKKLLNLAKIYIDWIHY